jgi:hypothetical protein
VPLGAQCRLVVFAGCPQLGSARYSPIDPYPETIKNSLLNFLEPENRPKDGFWIQWEAKSRRLFKIKLLYLDLNLKVYEPVVLKNNLRKSLFLARCSDPIR